MIKAIVFDCFGVLYVDTGLHFYHHHLANFSEIETELLELDKIYDRGLVSYEEHVEAVAELTGLEVDYVRQNLHHKIVPNPELLDYSQGLRGRYKVGMLSNIGVGGMDKFFDESARQRLFDTVVLSGEVGVVKPDVAIYQAMAERLGVETNECVMVDDRAVNCRGAEASGMKAIEFRTNRQAIAEIEEVLNNH